MGRGVISNQDYEFSTDGYLVDNLPWQGELKKRAEEQHRREAAAAKKDEPREESPIAPEFPLLEEIPAEAPISVSEEARAAEEASRILRDAELKASETAEQARKKAEEILSQARESAQRETDALKASSLETWKKEGLAAGMSDGLSQGKSEGLQSLAGAIQKWNEVLEQTLNERKRLLMEMKPLLSDLTAQALHQCLRNEAKINKEMVGGLVEETLKKAHDRVRLIVHLNPSDAGEVEAQKSRLKLSVGAGELEIVPDARIEQGGCLLETEAGWVDARLSTIASQAKSALNRES